MGNGRGQGGQGGQGGTLDFVHGDARQRSLRSK